MFSIRSFVLFLHLGVGPGKVFKAYQPGSHYFIVASIEGVGKVTRLPRYSIFLVVMEDSKALCQLQIALIFPLSF